MRTDSEAVVTTPLCREVSSKSKETSSSLYIPNISSDISVSKPLSVRLHWSSIKENKRVIKLYTGCSSAKLFDLVVDHVRTKHRKLKYYKGPDSVSDEPKQYQISQIKHTCQRKPGPSRIVSLEDEILIILMSF